MYGMTQTAIASSSPSAAPPSILPIVRKVRTAVATPIRSAGPSEERVTATKTSGSLHSYKGQKWNTFVESTDTLRDSERRGGGGVDDRDEGDSVMRLDCKEMAIYGVCPETDRFMAVVCHYCGCVVKPQSLKEHIKRHAKDPSAAFQHDEDTKLKPPLALPTAKGVVPMEKQLPDGVDIRDPGNLYFFKGQKWNSLIKNVDPRDVERKADDRLEAGSNLSRLDGAEMDRLPSVVCHFCGSVVKPHALQAHMNRHASDTAGDQATWSKPRIEGERSGGDEVECLASQLKPPMTATACMSSGHSGLQQGTSPSKGTTAPQHPDNVDVLDTMLLQSDLPSAAVKAARKSIGSRGRGRQAGKEREYDPDRHCGVPADSGKPCTRTLTCKSHALFLRRQVVGRSVPFDKLLLDHRNSRAARSRVTGSLPPDADSSNSSSSFDIERKSLSAASSSNSSGGPPVGSPLRPNEDPDVDVEHKISIKLTDCSVTLNKLKREHTTLVGAATSSAKRQHLEPPSADLSETFLDVQMDCSPILDTATLLTAPDQQLTVAVPLSMISVMNLSGSVTEAGVVAPAVHPESGLFTLSNRARRDHNRLKLHLLRRPTKTEENPTEANAADPTEEFPDIDTWHSSIPRPCQVNSMKLRRIGGGSILSRRFCNFRKALLANMSTNMVSNPGGQTHHSGSSNVGTVASLLSGRSGVGGGASKHTVYLDKVNFPGERIKV